MNTNNAPDKIYINGFSAFATEPVKEGIEYIRKDVVMDILKNAVHLAEAACKIDLL